MVNDPIKHTVVAFYRHADARSRAGVGSAVAEEAAALLAWLQQGAALAALAGAHHTAGAVVQHGSHPGGAAWRRLGTPGRTLGGTALGGRDLSQDVEQQEGQANAPLGQTLHTLHGQAFPSRLDETRLGAPDPPRSPRSRSGLCSPAAPA